MKPADLSELHQKAFEMSRGWSASEFEDLLASEHVHLFTRSAGFALLRVVAGEAELLTLAVDPTYHRRGIASALMRDWMEHCDAETAFLEVAEDNLPALALYTAHGFEIAARRRRYYPRPHATPADALLMQTRLSPRPSAESGARVLKSVDPAHGLGPNRSGSE